MTGPRVDYTISVGNILTIVGGVIAIILAYAALNGAVARLEERFLSYEAGARDREVRIRALELGASRTDEKLLSILASLNRIEAQLRGETP